MEKLEPEFKFLETCQPLELLRINLGEQTEWGLTGRAGNGLFPVLVLSGEDAPRCFNAAEDPGGNLKIHFLRAPTLSYGHAYTLVPDLAGPCDVYEGPLFSAHGALVVTGPISVGSQGHPLSNARKLLRVKFANRPYVHFDLLTGALRGAPEGNQDRAAFGRWVLLLNHEANDPKKQLCVMQFSAEIVSSSVEV